MNDFSEDSIQTVLIYVRQQIFETRTLAPGDRINEREISRELNMSRAPVREALRELEEQGLIASVKYKGWFVPSFTEEQALEINKIRTLLEGHLLERAIELECYTAADLEEAQKLHDEMISIEREEDSIDKMYRFHENEMKFHFALCSVSKGHCELAEKLLKNLAYQIRLSISFIDSKYKAEFMEYSNHIHNLILKCLQERNLEGFRMIIRRRLTGKRNLQNLEDGEFKLN